MARRYVLRSNAVAQPEPENKVSGKNLRAACLASGSAPTPLDPSSGGGCPGKGHSGPKNGHSRGGAGPVSGGTSGTRADSARLVNCAISERNPRKVSTSDFLQFIYEQAPVVGFRVHKNDVETIRKARFPDELADRLEGAERGTIEFLSSKSRRRLALIAGNSDVPMRSFVTVTYPNEFPCDGHLVKVHLHALLAALRRKDPGLSYLWFLEFQRRGAPHFHAFLSTALPCPLEPLSRRCGRVRKSVLVNRDYQDWISRRWFEIVGSGDEKHLKAGAAWEVVEKPDGAARYVSKESYKTFQKSVPEEFQNVGRFWGCSRDLSLPAGKEIFCTLDRMKDIFPEGCFDPEGNPFPVMFGAASAFREIESTLKNPEKERSWKSQKEKLLPGFVQSSCGSKGDSASPFPVSRKPASRIAKELWHGSVLNG